MIKKTIIIGLILVFALNIGADVPLSWAAPNEPATPLTEPEIACKDEKPKYDELMKVWTEAEIKSQGTYTKAFEAAQVAYHNYIGCMFDFAEKTILKSDGAKDSGTAAANFQNTGGLPVISSIIDWMAPDQACLSDTELSELIKKTEPSQMLPPILTEYASYRSHLLKLGQQFDGEDLLMDESGKALGMLDALNAKSANFGTLKRQRQMEIDSALGAIDLMFSSLKELRLAFVMHVRFQCTLKFLDGYRRALEDLRKVIEPLPNLLEDASID